MRRLGRWELDVDDFKAFAPPMLLNREGLAISMGLMELRMVGTL